MKIKSVAVSQLDVPCPPPRSSRYPHNTCVVVRVRTDEGIEGLGYTMLVGGDGASSVRAYLHDNIAHELTGDRILCGGGKYM